MPRRPSGRSAKSTAASTPSTSPRCSTRCAASPSQNAQGEYYLTDLVAIYRRRKLPVETLLVDDSEEIRGINSRTELAEVSSCVRQKKNEELMAAGVTLIDPATTYIDPDVRVGPDTVIHPGVVIEGQTRIGAACEIQAHVRIADYTRSADQVTINNFCLIVGARVADGAAIGPFAHLRPETEVGQQAQDRQFRGAEEDDARRRVEGEPSGVPRRRDHRAPTSTSAPARSPATTTARTKHQTVIEDGAFIGSDSQLIAPVRVGKGAYVGGGIVDHARTCPPARSASRAGARRTSRAGSSAEERGAETGSQNTNQI